MHSDQTEAYAFVTEAQADNQFLRYLQNILNEYNHSAAAVAPPQAKSFCIRVMDAHGTLLGGAIFLIYWNWLRIDVMAVEENVRGQGIGQHLVAMMETQARQEGCSYAHTTTFGFQALSFYQQLGYEVVGKLDNYPQGQIYYWLSKTH